MIKFNQDLGCPALAKHGYICLKDVTASYKLLDRFNNKSPKIKDQDQTSNPVSKRVSDDYSSNQVPPRRVHLLSVSNSTLDSTMPQAPIENTVLPMPYHVPPIPTSNRYNAIYSSDSDDGPLFEEMVAGKNLKPINTYSVLPQLFTLASTPNKVLKKKRKIRDRTRIVTIKRAQSDTKTSTNFILTALHSVYQAITRTNTNKIAIYNNKDTASCEGSEASE